MTWWGEKSAFQTLHNSRKKETHAQALILCTLKNHHFILLLLWPGCSLLVLKKKEKKIEIVETTNTQQHVSQIYF